MSARIVSISAAALAIVIGSACNRGTSTEIQATPTLRFDDPVQVPTGSADGRNLTFADIDQDGTADILINNATQANVSVVRTLADGSMIGSALVTAPVQVSCAEAADIDGDHVVDLIAASSVSPTITISRGRGDGSFSSSVAVSAPWPIHKLEIADWNKDGIADMVANSAVGAEVAVMLGLGSGSFSAPTLARLTSQVTDFRVIDADRDTRPDLVCVSEGSNRIIVLRNNGNGGMQAPTHSVTGVHAGEILACDLDGNRMPDLVALDAGRTSVTVYLAVASISYSQKHTVTVPQGTIHSMSLGDLDGDGWLDIILGAANKIYAAYGEGTGTFRPVETVWSVQGTMGKVMARDMRGRGVFDIVYIENGDQVAVLKNPATTTVGMESYGRGTPDCSGRIGMWANHAPTVGDTDFAYLVSNAPVDSVGLLLLGGPAITQGADPLGIGVTFHIGFGALETRLVFSDHVGAARIPDPVPNLTSIVGLPVFVQTMWSVDMAMTCSPSPLGLASSRGLTVTIGE
jgi:hypothetical protein